MATQGRRLGKPGAQIPLNLALQLAQLPSPEIHVLLSCFQVFKYNAAIGLTHVGEGLRATVCL